jgi:UDP:flavonoid glycosyltransferase YjiC (YdhE family)
MWGPLLVVQEEARVPQAIVSYVAACMLPGLDGPIMGVPLPRPRGALGRLGRRVLRSLEKMVAARVRRGAEEVRARHGLSPMRTSVTEFAGRMPLYLVPSTPAFDRSRRDLPASVRYIGACLWDKPDGTPPAPWLAELPSDQRVVYVTEGTMHSKPPLVLAAALQGLASLPVRVIATTGVHRDPEKLGLGPIPANARVERWVPHSDVLPRADVVVTTGGTGTVLAALCAGLPLVVVPTAWDQPENAWRVAETGAGIRVPPRSCTPERIRDSVARVLADESFRRNARRLRADLAAHGGAAEAADLLVALVPGREGRARRDAPALTAELVRLRGAQAPRPALESTPPPEAVTPNGHAPAAPPRPGPQGGGH